MARDEPQERPHETVKTIRFCRACGKRLSAYNKGDECFSHGHTDGSEEEVFESPIPLDEIEEVLRSGDKNSINLLRFLPHGRMESEIIQDPVMPTFDVIMEAISGACNVPRENIASREQIHKTVLARRVAIYLLHRELGMQPAEMSDLLDQPYCNVQHLFRKAEREFKSKPLFRILVKATASRYGSRLPFQVQSTEGDQTRTETKIIERKENEMPQTIEDLIRKAARKWVDSASVAELAACVPADALRSVIATVNGAGDCGVASPGTARKAARQRRLTKSAREMILSKLDGLEPGSDEYVVAFEALTSNGYSKSQIVEAMTAR